MIKRRQFITQLSLGSAAAVAFPGFLNAANLFSEIEYVESDTTHGRIRGIREAGVNIYKGIPYAGKVSGERRFRRAAPLTPWLGVREAAQLGAPAIQPPNQTFGKNEPKPDEDCLFLNVWTPASDNKKRPVMFYNHGGGFQTGSGGSYQQDGANLARYFDVVVVQTNHRLGIMGYLYLDEIAGSEYAGSGNSGLLDIVDGLEWVNKNIAEFGGDPNNVMIFGESGGGAKTTCLYALPDAEPYFNKASIESGPGIRMTPQEIAKQTTDMVLKELNISKNKWRKLLDIPAADLLSIQLKLPQIAAKINSGNVNILNKQLPGSFSPVVDKVVLPYHPFDPVAPAISKNKPLMVGWNEDEYTFWGFTSNDKSPFVVDFTGLEAQLEPQFGSETKKIIQTYRETNPNASAVDILVAIQSINMMGLGSIEIAEKKVRQNGATVYLYNFGYKSELKVPCTNYPIGTPHAMDITFKFNNEVPPKEGEQARIGLGGSRNERYAASHNMAALWTSFARNGKPETDGIPEWPAYNLTNRPTMRIDAKCEVINNRFAEELKMWRSIGKL